MSIDTDSPLHSSNMDDFVAYLDDVLDSSSPNSSSSDKDAENSDEFESVRIKRQKIEVTEETMGSTLEGTMGHKLEAFVEGECTHPGSFGYIHKGLRLHDEEISRLRNTNMNNMLCRKKLFLVLDLDHTLINTTPTVCLNSEESRLLTQIDSLGAIDVSNGSLFKLKNLAAMTKLRPFVRTFLKEANEMFEMYIYTLARRPYAREIVEKLDPRGEYFNGKVISREDGAQEDKKSLDVVPGKESAILILDDSKHVWMENQDNVIQITRYHFFASSCRQFGLNCKSLAELKSDENETKGALAYILDMLKRIHRKFFDELEEDLVDRDVRKVLSSVRSENKQRKREKKLVETA